MKAFKDLTDLFPHPSERDGSRPSGDEVQSRLDKGVVDAFKEPWDEHLADATDDVIDAVWGVTEGQRMVRELKKLPEKI